jgi:hypothetical protein
MGYSSFGILCRVCLTNTFLARKGMLDQVLNTPLVAGSYAMGSRVTRVLEIRLTCVDEEGTLLPRMPQEER